MKVRGMLDALPPHVDIPTFACSPPAGAIDAPSFTRGASFPPVPSSIHSRHAIHKKFCMAHSSTNRRLSAMVRGRFSHPQDNFVHSSSGVIQSQQQTPFTQSSASPTPAPTAGSPQSCAAVGRWC
jgi:hypothetical protein